MGIQNCQAYKLWALKNLVRFRYLITIHFWNWTIIILPGKCILDCIFFKTFFWKTQKEKPACFTFDYIQIAHEQINSRHIHTCITIKCRIWINIAAFKDSHEETVHIIIKNNSSVTLWTTLPPPPPLPGCVCLHDLTLPHKVILRQDVISWVQENQGLLISYWSLEISQFVCKENMVSNWKERNTFT